MHFYATDWGKSEIVSFINDKLNYWPMHYPVEDFRDTYTNPWKCWLWLESRSFDFWRNSYFSLIYSYKNERHWKNADVSDDEEQFVIFELRNAMRNILALPELDEEGIKKIRKVSKIPTHRSVIFVEHNVVEKIISPDELGGYIERFVTLLETQYADRVFIYQDAAKLAESGSVNLYIDNFTGIGEIPLIHSSVSEGIIFWETIGCALDCEIKMITHDNNVRGKILKSVKGRLCGRTGN